MADIITKSSTSSSLLTAEKSKLQPQKKFIKSKCQDGSEWIPTLDGPPRCCQQCIRGEGMLQLCTQTNNTECRQCTDGMDYSDTNSAVDKCMPCTICADLHPEAITLQKCTASVDAVCRCPTKWYLSMLEFICKPCTQCNPKSEEKLFNCSDNHDVICRACQPNHYLINEKCVPCSLCSNDNVEVMKCSLSRDTVCCPLGNAKCLAEANLTRNSMSPISGENDGIPESKNLPKSNPSGSSSSFSGSVRNGDWRQFLQYRPSANDSDKSNESRHLQHNVPTTPSSGSEFIPLYCALMGLVIFSLVIYVVYKHWARYRQSKGSKNCLSKRNTPSSSCASGGNVLMSEKCGNYPSGYTPLMLQSVRTTSPEGISKPQPYPRHDHRKLNSLPESTLTTMKEALCKVNNANGWKDLAKELGYSPAEIYAMSAPSSLTYSHMTPISNTTNNQSNGNGDYRCVSECVDTLLRDWMVRDTATVARFTRALHRVHLNEVIGVMLENERILLAPSILSPSTCQFATVPTTMGSPLLSFGNTPAC